MGWSIGWDSNWKRDIGYGVPSVCDRPDCNKEIDRGLSHVCGEDAYGGEHGCGLYFCSEHLAVGPDDRPVMLCERCGSAKERLEPFPAKPDTLKWLYHKMTDPSWAEWRKENGLGKDEEP